MLATFPTLALASIRTLGRRNRMKVKCLRQSHFPAGTQATTKRSQHLIIYVFVENSTEQWEVEGGGGVYDSIRFRGV